MQRRVDSPGLGLIEVSREVDSCSLHTDVACHQSKLAITSMHSHHSTIASEGGCALLPASCGVPAVRKIGPRILPRNLYSGYVSALHNGSRRTMQDIAVF